MSGSGRALALTDSSRIGELRARAAAESVRLARAFMRFDPAAGRGYRIGDQRAIPALAGFPPLVGFPIPAELLVNHGFPDEIRAWKATLHVTDPTGVVPALTGAGLRFIVRAKMENDLIPRQCFVSVGNAQVIYAPGRSIEVQCFNPNAFVLTTHWQIDEATAGLAAWEDQELFLALAVQTPMTLPPFCDSFEVYSPGPGAPAPRVRGYGPLGVVVYDQTLPVPASGIVTVIPNVAYTIAPTAAPQDHIVRYACIG